MSHSFLTKNIVPGDIRVKNTKGSRFWDINNKVYLDFSSQIFNLNFNNSQQADNQALLKHFDNYTYLSPNFSNDAFIKLSEKLVDIAPEGLTKVNMQLTNGEDANESAFKRTRIFRKKPYILSFYWSDLGESCETLKANGKTNNPLFFGGSSYFIHLTPPFLGLKTESQVLNKIELLFRFREDIAAIILEPLMINAGGYAFSKFFLSSLRSLCDNYKITLIFDEVHSSFGPLGTYFAADYFGVTPDILTIGNSIASGFPMGATLMKEEYDVLDQGYDEYTYGGHPLSCTIALENITNLENSGLLEKVAEKNVILEKLFGQLEKDFRKVIREIRLSGIIAGIEFINYQFAMSVYEKSLQKGLLLKRPKHNTNSASLILKPPLIVDEDEIEEAVDIIRQSIEETKY